MNSKKEILKKYTGKGGPMELAKSVGSKVKSMLINNPVGRASGRMTAAFMDKMDENKRANGFINRAAKRGFDVPNSLLKEKVKQDKI